MTPNEIIRNAVRVGEDNAVKSAVLEELTGLTSRDVKRCIEDLRRKGVVICSSNSGYFYPDNETELRQFISKETNRAQSIKETLKSAKKLLKKWGGGSG